MNDETDPMVLYRRLREKQERGELPPGPATTWVLEQLQAAEARLPALPEAERAKAMTELMAYLALTAVADVDKRLAEVERKLERQENERRREHLQTVSYSTGFGR